MTVETDVKPKNRVKPLEVNEVHRGDRALAWSRGSTEVKGAKLAKEAIETSKLNFEVGFGSLYSSIPDGAEDDVVLVPNKRSIVRLDNGTPLGVVGSMYQTIQNEDAFSFFDTLIQDGLAEYENCGSNSSGSQIWISSRLKGEIKIGDDVVQNYVLLVNSHDGSIPLQALITPVRLSCLNSISHAISRSSNRIVVRHSGNIGTKIGAAREILTRSLASMGYLEECIKRMSDRKMTDEEINRYFDMVVFGSKKPDNVSNRLLGKKNKLLYLFEKGRGNELKEVKGTAWAAYNSVTEFVDHYQPVRKEKSDSYSRMENVILGTGSNYKKKAFDLIMDFCSN